MKLKIDEARRSRFMDALQSYLEQDKMSSEEAISLLLSTAIIMLRVMGVEKDRMPELVYEYTCQILSLKEKLYGKN